MSRISVLLPVRDGLPFLKEAVDSVLAQSFSDFELIVIDDGSVDGSGDAIRAIADHRIRLITTGGVGIAAALNKGLAVASGEFIARQDADDASAPERLARQVAVLDRHPDVTVVSSRVRFVDVNGRMIETPWTRAVHEQWETALTPTDIATLLPQTCCILHGSVMARRDAMLAVGGYDESLPVAQDYDLWLRMLPNGKFARLAEPLYTFRIHPSQISARRGHDQAAYAVAAKLRYLNATALLPEKPRATLVGSGAGIALYRAAIHDAGWSEVTRVVESDVVVFTDFSTLDRDMQAATAVTPQRVMRIGNFLIAGGPR